MAERRLLLGKGEAGRVILRKSQLASRLGQRRQRWRRQIVVQIEETLQNRNELAKDREHVPKIPEEAARGAFADDDDVVSVDLGILELAGPDGFQTVERGRL